MKSAASVMRDLNYSTTDHTSLPIAAPQTATIRAPADGPSRCGKQRSCRSELRCPSRAAISSFGFVEGFGGRLGHAPGGTIVHLTCDPKSMQAAKKKHPLGKRNVGGPLRGPLCEPTTVVGWCFPGDFA